MRIVFLGTGGGMPSKYRGLPAIAVRTGGAVLLLDCGEGTQRQFINSRIGFRREFHIFLTHHHGDHVLGVPGLLFTMAMSGRKEAVKIYGPEGTHELILRLTPPQLGRIPFQLEIEEMDPGKTVRIRDVSVGCVDADHSQTALAYYIQEDPRPGRMKEDFLQSLGVPRGPLWGMLQRGETITYGGRTITPEEALGPRRAGRRVIYTGDTRPSEKIVEIARDADVLIHDSTFDDAMRDTANLEGHSTSRQAAEVAARSGVSILCLVHISPRYENPVKLLADARSLFPRTILPQDLEVLDVPYRDATP
ncbi:MAG: ribonuclease Z [Nitrososphaerota archaeon]